MLPVRDRLGVVISAGLLLLAGCSDSVGDSRSGDSQTAQVDAGQAQPDAAAFSSIDIQPARLETTVQVGANATQTFSVTAVINGQTEDITAECSFFLGDSAAGSFVGSTLTLLPRSTNTEITASCRGVQGTAPLLVSLDGTFTLGDAPSNSAELFASATVIADSEKLRTPRIEYPLDDAVAPRNIPQVEAQWTAADNDLFHLRIRGPRLAIDVYTTEVEFQLDQASWLLLADSSAGETITYSVEGTEVDAPEEKFVSDEVKLRLSRDRINETALYYWASSEGALMNQTFGDVDAPTRVRGNCTSCHSLSRAGTRIAYSRCVDDDCVDSIYGGFMRYNRETDTWVDTVDADDREFHGSYATFAPVGNPFPDDSQAVALFAMQDGYLELFNPDTGDVVTSNAPDMTAIHPTRDVRRTATMPDWSPDGTLVAFASTPNPNQWIDVSESAIALMDYTFAGGTHNFSRSRFLIEGELTLTGGTYNNFFFPTFSPDGRLIAFNAARSSWRTFVDARSNGARIGLTDLQGNVFDLVALNGPGDLNTTWARWAPVTNTDFLWIAFSSERDYGHRVTEASSPESCKRDGVRTCKQIWISAIEKNPSATGGDPSHVPVWLPGQATDATNISPYWTLTTTTLE